MNVRVQVERRAFGRKNNSDHAIVRVPGRPVVHCQVKNISPAGALLDLGAEVWLPYNFKLVWEANGRSEDCEVRHRNGQYIGVVFVREAAEAKPRETISANDVAPWIAQRR